MASANYEAKRNDPNSVTAWLVHIHFPAFLIMDPKDFFFSTTDKIPFDINGSTEIFNGRLRGVPRGRHQRDRGNDYAEFVLSNPHNATYQEFLDYENLIEQGEVNIYQCFNIEGNYWEGEIRFVGYLKGFTLNESDKSLNFTAMSDMSRDGYPVGARILTRERCAALFNWNGLRDPTYDACGWTMAQGGNPFRCTKFLKGVDGCIAHGNAHRFYAVSALSIATITFVPDAEIDFPYTFGPAGWKLSPLNF